MSTSDRLYASRVKVYPADPVAGFGSTWAHSSAVSASESSTLYTERVVAGAATDGMDVWPRGGKAAAENADLGAANDVLALPNGVVF